MLCGREELESTGKGGVEAQSRNSKQERGFNDSRFVTELGRATGDLNEPHATRPATGL